MQLQLLVLHIATLYLTSENMKHVSFTLNERVKKIDVFVCTYIYYFF